MNRDELKARALLETISTLTDNIADLRVEVTVLSATVDRLQKENDDYKERLGEDGSVPAEASTEATTD